MVRPVVLANVSVVSDIVADDADRAEWSAEAPAKARDERVL
jgi:hypothetical protein